MTHVKKLVVLPIERYEDMKRQIQKLTSDEKILPVQKLDSDHLSDRHEAIHSKQNEDHSELKNTDSNLPKSNVNEAAKTDDPVGSGIESMSENSQGNERLYQVKIPKDKKPLKKLSLNKRKKVGGKRITKWISL